MIENVVGVLGLPLGVALNFLINGREYVVPMVRRGAVDRRRGCRLPRGSRAVRRLQVERHRSDPDRPGPTGRHAAIRVQAMQALRARRDEIVSLANSLHPKMVARGGGARDIELFRCTAARRRPADGGRCICWWTRRDAMGANLVNTHVRGRCVARSRRSPAAKCSCAYCRTSPTARSARAQMVIPVNNLEGKGYSGAEVRDGIILAQRFRDGRSVPRRDAQQRHHERRRRGARSRPATTGARSKPPRTRTRRAAAAMRR